jgi:hypothetical protein
MEDNNSELNVYDLYSIIKYIINNYEKFILLLLVFIIIYFIDYITNINAILYGVSQIPLSGAYPPAQENKKNITNLNKKLKKNKNLK